MVVESSVFYVAFCVLSSAIVFLLLPDLHFQLQQKKLDVFSNDIFINCLKFSDQVYLMVSEEEEDAIILSDKKSGYCVVFDPLDGSSNIDANISGAPKHLLAAVQPTAHAL